MSVDQPPRMNIFWTNADQQNMLLKFDIGEPLGADELVDLQALVNSFVTLGSSGGFPREMVSPAESTMSLVQVNLADPTTAVFGMTARHVDVRAFQLVRNMAWRWSVRAERALTLTVSDVTHGHPARDVPVPDVTWGSEEIGYPPQSQRVTIRVEREEPADYQKERRCLVEFGRKVSNDVFSSVANRINEWAEVGSRGGYGPPVRPSFEAEVWPENIGPYDEYSAELALSLFEASELAWNSLINCLQKYSDTVEPIVLVTIQ